MEEIDYTAVFARLQSEVESSGLTATAKKVRLSYQGLKRIIERGGFVLNHNGGLASARKVAKALDMTVETGTGAVLRLKQEQGRKARVEADLKEMALKQKSGQLIPAESIDQLMISIGSSVRRNFEAMRREIATLNDAAVLAIVDDYSDRTVKDMAAAVREVKP